MSLPTALNRASLLQGNTSGDDFRPPAPAHQAAPVPVPCQRENFIQMETKRILRENNNPTALIQVRSTNLYLNLN